MKINSYNFADDKIVFIDWLAIEAGRGCVKAKNNAPPTRFMPYGIKLKNFKPVITDKPFLTTDKPWETGYIGSYVSIVQDPNDPRKVRLWYEVYPTDEMSDYYTLFCYAESTDSGLTFVKPDLGLVEWKGSKANNIVFTPEMHPNKTGFHGAGVFYDTNPNCPAGEKYKIAYDSKGPDVSLGYSWGATSPDGLTWNLHDQPIAKTWADTQTIARWNAEKEMYIGFFRSWHYGRRQIYYSESANFLDFGTPRPLITTDPTLPIDVDYYNNGYMVWPGAKQAHILFPTNYRRTINNLYVEMRCSRDLEHWYKMPTNPVISSEGRNHEFTGGFYLGQGYSNYKDAYWALPLGIPYFYHNELRYEDKFTTEYRLAYWRKDGFTGLVAEEKGEFWTIGGTFKGNSLHLNAWTHPRGSIKVGLVDSLTGQYLPGHSPNDCEIISGDPLRDHVLFQMGDGKKLLWKTVKWNTDEDLEDFDDVTVMLHFKITRGTIHAFKFGDIPKE